MATIAGSPLVGKKFAGLETCDVHGECVVIYQGLACPYCRTLDDMEELQYDTRDLRMEIAEMAGRR